MLLFGEIDLVKKGGGGKESIILQLKTGALFGEVAMLTGNKRNLDARASSTKVVVMEFKREFIEKFKYRISSLDENSNDDLTGFWVGVLDIRDKLQLVILDVQQDKKSEFVLMLNGVSGTNETYFNEEDILVDQNIITISTSYKTFANQIILYRVSNNMLYGYLYSYHKGQVLEPTSFQLIRVRNKIK